MRGVKRLLALRRGLWLVLTIPFALVVFGTGCTAEGPRNGTDLSNLPQDVRQALDRAAQTYPQPLEGATWSRVHAPNSSEHSIYQVRGTNSRGNEIEIEVTAAGRIIEVEERGIRLDEVPAEVVEALKSRLPGANPDRVEAIYQGGHSRPVAYGFEGLDGTGKRIEVYLSADGKTFLN